MIDRRPYTRSTAALGDVQRDDRCLRVSIERDAFVDGTTEERVVISDVRGFGGRRAEIALDDVPELVDLLSRAKPLRRRDVRADARRSRGAV